MKKNNDLGNFNGASESLKNRMIQLDHRDNNGKLISWIWLVKHGTDDEKAEIKKILGVDGKC